eukprot:TRINITY_DN7187_c0_g1_i1.p1 TRINITY_DN7187_c0_g1~~TRINITY_DN7187_c0_g1_i1.p1  ORF type:complete len:224 (+),score=10.86 TRINITY_DN7187_c0_g1_i1:92-763(+)
MTNTTIDSTSSYTTESIALSASALSLMLIYHVVYALQVIFCRERTVLGYNLKNRAKWVALMMNKDGAQILSIQNLRNGLMTATFFATSSFTVAFYFLSLAKSESGLLKIQYLSLSATLFVGFLMWVVVIKGFNHSSFLMTTVEFNPNDPTIAAKRERSVRKVVRVMTHATIFYFVGIRAFYFGVVIAAWLVEPITCFVVSIIMVVFMAVTDHSHSSKPKVSNA